MICRARFASGPELSRDRNRIKHCVPTGDAVLWTNSLKHGGRFKTTLVFSRIGPLVIRPHCHLFSKWGKLRTGKVIAQMCPPFPEEGRKQSGCTVEAVRASRHWWFFGRRRASCVCSRTFRPAVPTLAGDVIALLRPQLRFVSFKALRAAPLALYLQIAFSVPTSKANSAPRCACFLSSGENFSPCTHLFLSSSLYRLTVLPRT